MHASGLPTTALVEHDGRTHRYGFIDYVCVILDCMGWGSVDIGELYEKNGPALAYCGCGQDEGECGKGGTLHTAECLLSLS